MGSANSLISLSPIGMGVNLVTGAINQETTGGGVPYSPITSADVVQNVAPPHHNILDLVQQRYNIPDEYRPVNTNTVNDYSQAGGPYVGHDGRPAQNNNPTGFPNMGDYNFVNLPPIIQPSAGQIIRDDVIKNVMFFLVPVSLGFLLFRR